MARDLKLQVLLQAVDKMSGPLNRIAGGSSAVAEKMRDTINASREMEKAQRKISSFKRMNTDLATTAGNLDTAQQRVRDLREQMRLSGGTTNKFKTDFRKANEKVRDLTTKLQEQRRKLGPHGKELRELGISTNNLGEHEEQLKEKIDAANRSLNTQKDRMKAINDQQVRLAGVKDVAGNVRSAAGRVRERGTRLAGQAAVAGAAGGYFFKTQFLDRAAEFEKYQTILKTVTGSEQKAADAMSWVSDFAAKTPYELAEVLESFTRLKAYGIDPMADGLLRTLGDTASAMGKPVMQAVEAIADAVTGENERLKEFGIKGSKDQGVITYEFTNAAGDTMTRSVDASNRKLIQSTLAAIWNEKYAGAMDEQSRTWSGMVSNLSDQWARFTNMVMNHGLFERMKTGLRTLLDEVDRMAANGELQVWAKKVGESLLKFGEGAWRAGTALANVTSSLAHAVGGWENLFYIMTALKVAPLALSLVDLGGSLFTLGTKAAAFAGKSTLITGALTAISGGIRTASIALWGLAMNPVFLAIAAAVAVVAGAAFLIWQNWDWLVAKAAPLLDELKAAYDGGLAGISALILNWSPLGLFYKAFAGAMSWLGVELPDTFTGYGRMIIEGLANGITGSIDWVMSAIGNVADKAEELFRSALGIHSPSRLFAQLGMFTMQGLGIGIERGSDDPLQRLKQTATRIAQGGAIALGMATPIANASAVQIDTRPPVAGAAPAASYVSNDTYNITVQSQPGMSEQTIAQLVVREVSRISRESEARQRSALFDHD